MRDLAFPAHAAGHDVAHAQARPAATGLATRSMCVVAGFTRSLNPRGTRNSWVAISLARSAPSPAPPPGPLNGSTAIEGSAIMVSSPGRPIPIQGHQAAAAMAATSTATAATHHRTGSRMANTRAMPAGRYRAERARKVVTPCRAGSVLDGTTTATGPQRHSPGGARCGRSTGPCSANASRISLMHWASELAIVCLGAPSSSRSAPCARQPRPTGRQGGPGPSDIGAEAGPSERPGAAQALSDRG